MTSRRPGAGTPLVIGVGNRFRRDDGVGGAVIDELRNRDAGGRLLRLVESDGEPTRLLDLWDGAELVIVVDAMRSGAAPGTVRSIDAESASLPGPATASTHAGGVGHAVELGRVLDRLPGRLVVVGVEGSDFSEGPGLTAVIRASVGAAADAVAAVAATAAEAAIPRGAPAGAFPPSRR